MSETKKAVKKGKGVGTGGSEGSKRTQFEKEKPPEYSPLHIYSEWGTMADLKKVVTQRPEKGDSLQLKALRKLFREDYKGYLQLYERLLKMEVAESEARVKEMQEANAQSAVVKREELKAGGQERRVEELIVGLLEELKS